MSYDVSFKARLAGTQQWVYVGADWINYPTNSGNMIKEVCGSYPSDWAGKKCEDMRPILTQGISLLTTYPQKYRCFEPDTGLGKVESTIVFLQKILTNCEKYPTAVLEVNF